MARIHVNPLVNRYPFTVLCFVISLSTFFFIVIRRSQRPTSLDVHKIKKILDQKSIPLDISYVEENLNHLDQKDPRLIQYVRARHLSPPSKLPYKLKDKGYYNDSTIDWVLKFFADKRDGVFIEVGAFDGEQFSHTLYLEKELGWTGLLIECNPILYATARSVHRKAWLSNACLSLTSNAGIQIFAYPKDPNREIGQVGTLNRLSDIEKQRNYTKDWINVDVDTVPLYTLLAALGWKEIDYFNFDIEGTELAVLRAFPFDKVIFKVLVIESQFYNDKEIVDLNSLMKSHGYHYIKTLGEYKDFIYVHESVKHLVKEW